MIVGKLEGKQLSRETLLAGLPLVNNRLTPKLFVRASQQGDFSSKIAKRAITDIPPLLTPLVLVLKNNRACVLTKIVNEKRGNGKRKYEVVFPETAAGKVLLTEKQLEAQYEGFCIFIKPEVSFEDSWDEVLKKKEISKFWFWGTLWKQRKVYANVALATLVINVFAIASSLFVMNVYDRVIPNNATDTLWVLASGITLVFLFDFLMKFLRGHLIDRAGKKSDLLIASNIFHKLMSLKGKDKPASAGHFANLIRGYESLREFFTSASMVTLVDFPFVLLFIFFIFLIAQWIAFIPLVAVLLIIIIGSCVHVPLKKSAQGAHESASQRHALLVESINSYDTLKGLCAEGVVQRKMEDALGNSGKLEVRSRHYSSLATYSTMFIQQMVTVATVVIAVYRISEGEMSMGALIATMMLSGRALAPLGQIVSLLARLQQSLISLKELGHMMDLTEERPPHKNFVNLPEISTLSIELENVSFVHDNKNQPEDSTMPTLKNISTKIEAGSRVGVIGRVGAGKSTFLKLLMGFYDATEGVILFGGKDIKQLDPADLRRKIAYVAQTNRLLQGTLRSNVMLGMPWADEEQFSKVIDITNIDKFSSHHPLGYDLPISEGGETLSGGQSQAISISQALLNEPKILLLDEPTSSMDVNSEQSFVKKIDEFIKEEKRTLILATHKPAMLSLVDRVIVLDHGKIVADGPKENILEKLSQVKPPKPTPANAV